MVLYRCRFQFTKKGGGGSRGAGRALLGWRVIEEEGEEKVQGVKSDRRRGGQGDMFVEGDETRGVCRWVGE